MMHRFSNSPGPFYCFLGRNEWRLRLAVLFAVLAFSIGAVFAMASPQAKAQPQQQAGQQPNTPPAAQKAAPKEEEEYEWVERPTPFGTQRLRVPKKKAEPSIAAPPGAAPPGGAGPQAPPAAALPASGAAQGRPPSAPEPGDKPQKPAEAQQPPPKPGDTQRPQPAAAAAPGAAAAQAAPGGAATPQAEKTAGDAHISLHLENANLTQIIGIIAAELKMNYIIDPNVKGVVNINTLGDLRQEDLLPLLQAILRSNGATAVQSGSFWRIVALKDAPRVPIALSRAATGEELPADDRMILNVVALRYVTAADMSKILGPYLSEAGQIVAHEPGNILLITETSRSMKRVMDLVNLFDTDTLAQQRLRLIPVQNTQAKDLVKDLQEIFKAYAQSEKGTAVRFLPIERINSILVVAGNPNVFKEVEQWVEKLDQPVRRAGIQNFVYKVENASAENLANVLASLYGGRTPRQSAGTGLAMLGGAMAPGIGSLAGGPGATGGPSSGVPGQTATAPGETGPSEVALQGSGSLQNPVRIVADTITNSLLIQATAQDYEMLRQTLKDMDIVPRQVMIEAKVYEVTLTGALAFGVEAFLQQRTNSQRKPFGQFSTGVSNAFPNPGLSLSLGTLVGHARELLLFLNAQENRGRTRVISAPTILASDNIAARIQVGAEIPILTSQGVTAGAQVGGNSVFTNTVQQRDTGVILSVTPRINPSGLVNMRIDQEVSSPQPVTLGSGIQSPSIQKRSVSTQITVKDGETIALGGIIAENRTVSKNRIPLLGDIPGLGLLFGSTSYSSTRTELIVMLTPHVIRDIDEAQEATDEFKSKLKGLRKLLRQN